MPMNNRLLRPRASGFDPRSLGGLALWLDANSLNSGETISSWPDKSSANRTVSQGTANNQPTTSTVNGKKCVVFDGSNDALEITPTIDTSSGSAMFAVVQRTGLGDSNGGIHAFTGAGSNNHHPFGGSYFEGFGTGTRRNWVQAARTDLHIYSVNVSSTTFLAFMNGSQVYSVSATPAAQSAGSTQGIGVGYITGGNFAGVRYHEFLVYEKSLSTTQIASVIAYLKKRWGIA